MEAGEGRELVPARGQKEPVRVVEGQVIPRDPREAQKVITRAERRENSAWARQQSLAAVPPPVVDRGSPLEGQMVKEGRPPAQPPVAERPKSFIDSLRDLLKG